MDGLKWHKGQDKLIEAAIDGLLSSRGPDLNLGPWIDFLLMTEAHMQYEEADIFPYLREQDRSRFLLDHAAIRAALLAVPLSKSALRRLIPVIKDHERREERAIAAAEGWRAVMRSVYAR